MGKWGYILLSVWLIITGLLTLSHFNLFGVSSFLPVLSLAAGILIFIEGINSKFSHNLGGLFLSIWLMATSLFSLTNISISASILAIIAVATGILLLIKK